MDHFPPVVGPHNPVHVPYLGGNYDGQDFADYPVRKGWSIILLQRGDTQGRTRAEVACFLQTWLYFGMLHEILGLQITTADFVYTNDAQESFLTTHKLIAYLHRWKMQVDHEREASQDDVSLQRKKRVVECLAHSHRFWQDMHRDDENALLSPEVNLSIHILASTLEHAVTSVCDIHLDDAPWRLTRNRFLTQRMLEYGWCPSVIEQICFTNHLAFQYYASLLFPPSDPGRHDNCHAGDQRCAAKNVVDADYVVRHERPDCDCEHITADLEAVRDIVGRGGIPLVHLVYLAGRPVLEVVELEKGIHYTAVSHVWSDGLGNPYHNSLPKCQVEKVARQVSSLPPFRKYSTEAMPIDDRVFREYLPYRLLDPLDERPDNQPRYFWMDTFCVPLTPYERRKDAIASMRSIYSRALRMLVLDADLMQATNDSCSEEKLARITVSTWIRRLWTLQEAALARTVYFQFATEPIVIVGETAPETAPGPRANPYVKWYDNEIAYYSHLFDFSWWKKSAFCVGIERVDSVWHSLSYRSTSKLEDEALCLATLLDLDLTDFLKAPDGARTKKLWSMCTQLPAAVLFLPGEKLIDESFGWAPRFCLDCRNISVPRGASATVTSRGLSVALPGFLLSTPADAAKELIACDLEGKIFYVRRNMKLGSPSWKGLEIHKINRLAVILGQSTMQDPTRRSPLVACLGALVSITETEDEIMFVKYIRMVSVIGKDCRYDLHPTPVWSNIEKEEKTRTVTADYVMANQQWCVG